MTDFPNEIKKLRADHRGRVNLGPEYAGKELRVAVVEVLDDG